MEDHAKRQINRGAQLLAQGHAAEALELFEALYQQHPTNVAVLINLGGACILNKQFKRAIPVLQAAANLEPDNPMIWTNLGAACLGNPVLATDEQQLQAIAAFERALEINPAAPNVAYNIGLIYRDRGEHHQAMVYLERALQANPGDRDARRLLDNLRSRMTQQ
jgi:tetratricopeptide (TPR) repeat protein